MNSEKFPNDILAEVGNLPEINSERVIDFLLKPGRSIIIRMAIVGVVMLHLS